MDTLDFQLDAEQRIHAHGLESPIMESRTKNPSFRNHHRNGLVIPAQPDCILAIGSQHLAAILAEESDTGLTRADPRKPLVLGRRYWRAANIGRRNRGPRFQYSQRGNGRRRACFQHAGVPHRVDAAESVGGEIAAAAGACPDGTKLVSSTSLDSAAGTHADIGGWLGRRLL